jgi:hypothetical protein
MGRVGAQFDSVESRVDDVLRAFDAQGLHRTGTDVDRASGLWLRREADRAGAHTRMLPFTLSRVDVLAAYVEVDGRRLEGLPLFDGGFTAPEGVSGPLGESGIRLAAADPAAVTTEGAFLAELRRDARVPAIVVSTAGAVPGLIPSNARQFAQPYGCPVLQVSAAFRPVLESAAAARRRVRVVCHVSRSTTTAYNVLAEVAGRDGALPPVVIITPRSGWWACAAERGGGLACWLEALRAAATVRPARRVLALASSGHELGHLGLDAFLHDEAALLTSAHAWLHLGANIGAGAPGEPVAGVRLQASEDAIERQMQDALERADALVADRLPRGREPRGEARNLHVGGARYVSLLGQGNRWFHHEGDRYPATVSAAAVARYARGVAAFVLNAAGR